MPYSAHTVFPGAPPSRGRQPERAASAATIASPRPVSSRTVHVRDSKRPVDAMVPVSPQAWAGLVALTVTDRSV